MLWPSTVDGTAMERKSGASRLADAIAPEDGMRLAVGVRHRH